MAKILIVDDRLTNREFLGELLGYAGHETLHACDGIEALDIVRAERPDLTICDLLMPRMDGYEFVRQVRAEEPIAGSNIIFYTATCQQLEAARLAEATGIRHIITKPAEPEEILRVVAQALRSAPAIPAAIAEEAFHADHVRLLTDSLLTNSVELEIANARLGALIDLAIDLAAERDIARLLENFAETAREIVPSRWNVVALFNPAGDRIAMFHAGGAIAYAEIEPLEARGGILGAMLAKGKPSRVSGLAGDPTALGFRETHPPLDSFLGVPLARGPEPIGWFYLADRIGHDGFTDEDEKIVLTLAAMLTVTVTNLRMSSEVRAHAVRLEKEITERRRAEKEILRLARDNAMLLNAAGEGIYGLDREGITTFVNPSAARMLGYSNEDLLGKAQHTLIHHTRPDGVPYPRAECKIYGALADGCALRVDDEVFWRKDGTSFPVEYNSVPLRDESGAVVGAVVTFNDITERRRAEEELRASEQKLRLLVEGVKDYALVMLDSEGHVASWNAAAERISGRSESEVLGLPIELCLRYEENVSADSAVEIARRRGNFEFEGWCIRADGSRFWVSIAVSPLLGADGTATGFAVLLRDRTDQKRREEELDQERRLSGLGHVAATIGHEFNNVLMGIAPFVEMLRQKPNDPEAVLRAVETISKSILRGKSLTSDILRFTRPAEPLLTPLEVSQWLASLRPELESLAGARAKVEIHCKAVGATVAGDPHQLAQVLTNLVANSRDAMDREGKIEITTELQTDAVVMTVRDNGSGMPPETMKQIFDPLFTSKRTGTGLGLAVAWQVIHKHHGSISVASEVGSGTTFTITLPLWREKQAAAS